MIQPISITSIASISALGSTQKEIWQNYLVNEHFLVEKKVHPKTVFVGQLSEENQQKITLLRKSDSKYRNLDDTVLFAIFVANKFPAFIIFNPSLLFLN